MKYSKFLNRNNIITFLAFALVLNINPLVAYAQKTNEEYFFQKEFEQTAQLIVMLSGDDYLGAGIIFGHDKDRLLIATASHVVKKGNQQPKNILVKIRTIRDTLKATLLKQVNEGDLDLAVLSIDNLTKQKINACAFPYAILSRNDNFERGDEVIPAGNPLGKSWVLPMEPDKISMMNKSQIDFQSTFIKSGHSGGGLLNNKGYLIGMVTEDEPPFGRAIPINVILNQLRQWGYPVLLRPVDFRENRYDPLLHKAAERGDLVEMRKLLTLCNNPNEIDFHYRTPLHYAALEGKTEAMSLLLQSGASLDVQDFNGCSPLYLAVSQNHFENVKLLIKAGAKIDSVTDEELLPLHEAMDTSINPEIAVFLIKSGADVNLQDSDNNTPLHHAVNHKNTRIVKALIAAGASPEVQNNYRSTPLDVAVSKESLEIIQLLITSGVSVNPKNTSTGPLHMAAKYCTNIETIKLLLKSGAKVNAINERGDTPLHYAVSRRNELNKMLEVMTVLLKAGADSNAKNKEGVTILGTAKNAQNILSNSSEENSNHIKAIESLLCQYGCK